MRSSRTSSEQVTVGTPDMRQPANASVVFFTLIPSCWLMSMVLALGSLSTSAMKSLFAGGLLVGKMIPPLLCFPGVRFK